MISKILTLGVAVLAVPYFTIAQPADVGALRKKALELITPIPDRMPGAEKDTHHQTALGKRLFFEKRLSMNGSQSCNSCHLIDNGRGGVDNQPTSPGAFGKRGGRNSPTVLNAGFQIAQFWDGRAESLEAQAKGPILNPIEMAMPNPAEALARLKADEVYVRDFKTAFPSDADPVTYDNLARAIAAFERTLITRDRFDDFLKGGDQALSEQERKGLHEFLTVGCTTCHNGPLIGGNAFKRLGILNPSPNLTDKGRIEVTKDEADEFVFKVPSLRNIALTGPYFHDGQHSQLAETVRDMAWLQLGQKLSSEQVSLIVAFLNSLSDKGRKVPQASVTGGTSGGMP